MMCICGSLMNVIQINGNTFQETAMCDYCGRQWMNTTPSNGKIVKPHIPLGKRHPRPRQDKYHA